MGDKYSKELADLAYLNAVGRIVRERFRQVREEGWSPQHDDGYRFGELAAAAGAYAEYAWAISSGNDYPNVPGPWPWALTWWKPRDRETALVKAGALILAELERLERERLYAEQERSEREDV